MTILGTYPIYAKSDGGLIELGDARSASDEAALSTALRFLRERAVSGDIGPDHLVWMMGPNQLPVLRPQRLGDLFGPGIETDTKERRLEDNPCRQLQGEVEANQMWLDA
jgi:hypothetical protein